MTHYLTFPEDSEVETFESNCFYNSHIKKLKIPAKLTTIEKNWCENLYDLTKIEISPKNNFFIYFNNDFLLRKSNENSKIYDSLYYARYDIEHAQIPSQIKVIKSRSFNEHSKLKTITFSEDSELKIIEEKSFYYSGLQKLYIPAKVEEISRDAFNSIKYLTEIEISKENKFFSLIENKFLVTKSDKTSKIFDVLLFALRDIENVTIPSFIKIIEVEAFGYCKKIKSFKFEPNSSLQSCSSFSFTYSICPEKIVFPPSFNKIDIYAFYFTSGLKYIEFLGKSVRITNDSFNNAKDILSISFPNAEDIILTARALEHSPNELKLIVNRDSKLSGDGVDKYKNMIEYIERKNTIINDNDKEKHETNSNDNEKEKHETNTNEIKKEKHETNSNDNEKEKHETNSNDNENEKHEINISEKNLQNQVNDIKKEKDNLNRYIQYLQLHLEKYEKFISYQEFIQKDEKKLNENPNRVERSNANFKLITSEDEEYQKVESKLGEGATSEVFKVKDTRTGEVFCKKVIKESKGDEYFKTLRNSVREIDVALRINHPCLCKCLGYNMEEELPTTTQHKEDEEEDYDDSDEDIENKEKKTTIAIFIEYLPFSVKSLLENKMMSNTLKTRIAIEVAIGMRHIHSLGMIHRDLKLENIMMNGIFESKIIDFGLVHIHDPNDESQTSLTKGIGTFSYMSPEMLIESEYDNKTDVYSYGILLFALFTG